MMNVTSSGSRSTATGLSSSLSKPTDQSTSARSTLPTSPDDCLSSDDVVHAHRVQHHGFTSESEQALTYLSVVWHAGTLGLAYFNTETSFVYMMMDTAETEDFQLLRQVPEQAARGTKPVPLIPDKTSYLSPRNQDHSMSRTKDTKTGSSAAVPSSATRRPIFDLDLWLSMTYQHTKYHHNL